MASTIQASTTSEGKQHKRTRSAVIKYIIPGNQQRKPTAPAAYFDMDEEHKRGNDDGGLHSSILPSDHPHTRLHLREDSGNRNVKAALPKWSDHVQKENAPAGRENIDLACLSPSKSSLDKKKGKTPKKRSGKEEKPMKKSKSATSLSALLSRPRSSKGLKAEETREKEDEENQKPLSTGDLAPPPIWAQFVTQRIPEPLTTTKIPLNDRRSIDEETKRYTSEVYSPSKQRNFQNSQKPTLSRRPEAKPRPKSECLVPRPTRESFAETVSSLQRPDHADDPQGWLIPRQEAPHQIVTSRQDVSKDNPSLQRPSLEHHKIGGSVDGSGLAKVKRGSRVMAAVAALGGNGKDLPREPVESLSSTELDPKAVESAFESLLDARNVPQNTRDKMRSLDTKIKADFISKDTFGTGSASSAEGLSSQSSRPSTSKRSKTDGAATLRTEQSEEPNDAEESPKKSRPRSRTFTFSKGDQSPSKKQKADRPSSHQRNKSGQLTPSASSKSLTPTSAAQNSSFFSKPNKPAVPEDFITYLNKVLQPEKIEVSKIHKLKQLLRNESVVWVDSFIAQNGMTVLVDLLYAIIAIEWRTEHEDALLHETLLCLKALSTTSSALTQLSTLHSKLFPTLLAMLFDKEKKGPAEFTTRGIIITLLHAYLTSSPSLDLPSRARIILSYLRDPSPEEEAQAPPEFITQIWHPRPYRIWHKELDNVAKEVFWIFLHHVNIIPYPSIPNTLNTYTARHFPREHPPVPAAPYIGGVEWDATNYFTANLDLMNGLLASLPSREERNVLRAELRDSGFEKLMGVSLRTCKESLYGCVHEALSTWVGAAREDGWPEKDVRQGPPKQEGRGGTSPKKGSPKKVDKAPRLEMPRLELGGESGHGGDEEGWL